MTVGSLRGGWLVGLIWFWMAAGLGAQDPAPRPATTSDPVSTARSADAWPAEVPLPAGQPVPPDAQRLVPVPLRDYESLRQEYQFRHSAPSGLKLERALYRAEWKGPGGLSGTWEWHFRHVLKEPRTWSLAALNFPVQGLNWSGDAATWGWHAERGNLVVLDPDRKGPLSGQWSASGKSFSQSVEFDLKFPPATLTQFRLRTPLDYELSAGAFTVRRLERSASSQEWEVDVGGEGRCLLRLVQSAGMRPVAPTAVITQDAVYDIGLEGLRLRVDLQLEALQAPLTHVDLGLDPELDLISISYGTDVKLNWELLSQDGRQRVRVKLPDPLQGVGRVLRLRAVAPLRPDTDWKLPQLVVKDGLLQSGTISLVVSTPLQISRFAADGMRQVGLDVTPQRQEIWTFKQFRQDALLTATLGTPRPRLSARVLSDLQLDSRDWLGISQIRLSASEGAAYLVPCRIPTGWEVIDVTAENGSAIVEWNLATVPGGGQHLVLQFLEAVAPGQPATIEVKTRRTPLPPNQPAPIPALEPLDLDELQMLLAVTSGADLRPSLELSTSFESLPATELTTDWTQTEFWQTRLSRRTPSPQLWRLSGTLPEGQFSLQTLHTPVQVVARQNVDLSPERTVKTAQLEITPAHGRVERLLVYCSEAGPPWTWLLNVPKRTVLEARKLPNARHAAWDLPPSGELWSIQLPQPLSQPFTIELQRSRSGLPPRLGLLFVPQAASFQGQLTVNTTPGLQLDFLASGLEQTGSTAATESAGQQMRWSWRTPAAQLAFTIRELTSSRIIPTISAVRFVHEWSAGASEIDDYRVTAVLGAGIDGRTLSIRWPGDCELIEVHVDGRPLPVETPAAGKPYQFSGLREAQQLELHYRRIVGRLKGPQSRRVVMPVFSLPVLHWEGELRVPFDLVPADPAGGVLQQAGLPQVAFSQRLFGPLGRVWKSSQEPPVPAVADDQLTTRQVWKISAATLPDPLEIPVWPRRWVLIQSWLGLCGCALAGVFARVWRIPGRRWFLALVLAVLVALALGLPATPAQVAGGCLSGLLLSLFLPRNCLGVWSTPKTTAVPQAIVPMGSTKSYEHGAVVTGLLVGLCLLGAATSLPAQPAATPAGPQAVGTVYLPASKSAAGGIALVPQDWWQRQQEALQERRNIPAWLIRRADYDLNIESDTSLQLKALFDVLLTSPGEATSVEFPLQPWNLDPAQPCLVDGQPVPVTTRPGSRSLWVQISPPTPPPQSEPAAADDRPLPPELPEGSPQVRQTPPRLVKVEFQGYLQVVPENGQPLAAWNLPAVQAATMRVRNSEAQRIWLMEPRGGQATQLAANSDTTVALGGTSTLQFRVPASTMPTPIQWEASQQSLVDIQPGLIRMHLRVGYRVLAGRVTQASWLLPAGVVIRQVASPDLHGWSLQAHPGGYTQVTLDFESPLNGNFLVDAELEMSNPGSRQQVEIPPVQLLNYDRTTTMRPTAHDLALRTSPEFLIEPTGEAAEHVSPLTVEAFLETWGIQTQRPQLALRLLAARPYTVNLRPLAPQRVVRRLELQGQLEPRRLIWQALATVEVHSAPAFQHVLEVDPRWIVTQVSVKEDDADRLLRWTRIGNLVYLYLRDRTVGTQTIQLQGTVPLQVPQEVALPTLKFLDATISEAGLQLFQDPELSVELVDPTRWARANLGTEVRLPTTRSLLVGRYQWPADSLPLVIRIAQNEPIVEHDHISILQQRDGRWRWTTHLIFHVRSGHGSQFLVRLPADLPQARILAPDVRQLQETEPDGARRVSLLPQQAVQGDFAIEVSAELTPPATGSWQLPDVRGLNSTPRELYLLIGGNQLQVPVTAQSGLIRSNLPAEIQRWLSADTQVAQYRQYVSATRPWIVQLPRATPSSLKPSWLWSETDLAFDSQGQVLGRTLFLFGPQEHVELEFPEQSQLQSISVDRQPAFASPSGPQRFRVPLSLAAVEHVVIAHWTGPAPGGTNSINQIQLALPRAVGLPPLSSVVHVTPPSGKRLLKQNGQTQDPQRARLKLAHIWLKAWNSRYESGTRVVDADFQYWSGELQRWWKRAQPELSRTAAGAEWNEVSDLMEQLAAVDPLDADDESTPTSLRLEPSPFSERLESEAVAPVCISLPATESLPMLSCSWWDERTWHWTGAALTGIIVGLFLMRLAGWKIGDRLSASPAVGWLALTVVWGLCLQPAWLTVVWALLAFGNWLWPWFHQISRRRLAEAQTHVSPPHEI